MPLNGSFIGAVKQSFVDNFYLECLINYTLWRFLSTKLIFRLLCNGYHKSGAVSMWIIFKTILPIGLISRLDKMVASQTRRCGDTCSNGKRSQWKLFYPSRAVPEKFLNHFEEKFVLKNRSDKLWSYIAGIENVERMVVNSGDGEEM